MKKILTGSVRLAKGAALFWGAALTLALLVGVGTTALAAVPGDPFRLGQMNAIDALTRLTGTANSAMLKIDNDSKAPNATALELRTDPKKPPMKVNSLGKVENLHADLLDGRSASQFANGVGGTADDADNLDGLDSTHLIRVASASNDSQALNGTDGTALSTNINAPRAGFLVIEASTVVNNVSESEERPSCLLRVDGRLSVSSIRNLQLSARNGVFGGTDVCPTNAVVPVDPGSHDVAFQGLGLETGVSFFRPAMSVLFVPFDGEGNPPAAPSGAGESAGSK